MISKSTKRHRRQHTARYGEQPQVRLVLIDKSRDRWLWSRQVTHDCSAHLEISGSERAQRFNRHFFSYAIYHRKG